MKADIHPAYRSITVKCSCGYEFVTGSALQDDVLNVEVCSNCHPYYTGRQKVIDTAGRVNSFKQRFSKLGQKPAVSSPTATTKKSEKKK
jgi:large subunit ribosomal protein L31